ncbi:tRNA (N6-isopentenyl adenosine(37)-C2)-methylthiotransferase MiaB, partial [Staphylococcus cohnii]
VLCEGTSKRDDTVLSGYTDKNKLVNFKAPKSMIGKIVDVKIDEAKQYSLNGTFVQQTQKTVVMP